MVVYHRIRSLVEVINEFNYEFEDFEDCLQEESAVEVVADYIVTRNPKDFEKSRVEIIQPDEFLKLLGEDKRL